MTLKKKSKLKEVRFEVAFSLHFRQQIEKFSSGLNLHDDSNLLTTYLKELCDLLTEGCNVKTFDVLGKVKQINLVLKSQKDVPHEMAVFFIDLFLSSKYNQPFKDAAKSCLQNITAPNISEMLVDRLLKEIQSVDRSIDDGMHLVETLQSCMDNFEKGKASIDTIAWKALQFISTQVQDIMDKIFRTNDVSLDDKTSTQITFCCKCACAIGQRCVSQNTKSDWSILNSVEAFCKVILSNDLFIGDCWNTAGLLIAVTFRLMSPSDGELSLKITELYENFSKRNKVINKLSSQESRWSKITNVKAKLSVCHGILAIIDPKVLARDLLGAGNCVLFQCIYPYLQDFLVQQLDSLSELLLAKVYVQFTLVLRNLHNDSAIHCSGDMAEISESILRYSFLKLDHTVDAIRHQARDILNNILYVKSSEENFASKLLEKTLQRNWHKRSTFNLLASVLHHVDPEEVLKISPDITDKLLDVMSDQSLVSYACEVYMKLASNSIKEPQHNLTEHHHQYLIPLLRKIATSSPHHMSLLIDYLFLKMVKLYDGDCLTTVVQYFKLETGKNSRSALMMCLRSAQSHGTLNLQSKNNADNTMWRGILPREVIRSALVDINEKTRLMAFSLLCESSKTTSLVTSDDLELIKYGVPYNVSNQCPAFRHQLLNVLKKVIVRVQDNVNSLKKKNKNKDENSLQDSIQLYKEFLNHILKFCLSSLHVDSPYPKRITLISLVSIILDTTAAAEPLCKLVQIWDIFNNKSVKLFWKLLRDNYDDVVQLSFSLLTSPLACEIVKTELNGMQVMETTAHEEARQCTKPEHCRHAAFQLRLFASLAQSHSADCIRICNVLLETLSEDIGTAKSSIYEASMNSPLYGSLHCISALFKSINFRFLSAPEKFVIRTMVERIIAYCFKISEIVLPVVGSISPEGHIPTVETGAGIDGGDNDAWNELPEAVQKMHIVDQVLDESHNRVIAQRILVCCWRSAKETSLLLQEVTSPCVTLDSTRDREDGLVSWEQLLSVGLHLKKQLLEARHRGAFELAFSAFRNYCPRLWGNEYSELSNLPVNWLKEMLLIINDPMKSHALCATRRSAGLPFFIQALLSDKSTSCRNNVPIVMKQLIDNCQCGNQLSMVHSLNILRALMRDATLAEAMLPYISQCTMIAITGFGSNIWAIRNASTLLYAALYNRIFGVKSDKNDESSLKNKLSSYELFTRLPGLYNFLLEKLEYICNEMEKDHIFIQPLLHPILLLLSNVTPSSLQIEKSSFDLKPFVDLVIRCGCTSVYKSRIASATALASMVFTEQVVTVMEELLSRLPSSDQNKIFQNKIHSVLLQMKGIVTIKITPNLTPSMRELMSLVTEILIKLGNAEATLASSSNHCPITRAAYLDFYLSLGPAVGVLNQDPIQASYNSLGSALQKSMLIEIKSAPEDGSIGSVPGVTLLHTSFANILFQQFRLEECFNFTTFREILACNYDEIKRKFIQLVTSQWGEITQCLSPEDKIKLQDILTSELNNCSNTNILTAILELARNLDLNPTENLVAILKLFAIRKDIGQKHSLLSAVTRCHARVLQTSYSKGEVPNKELWEGFLELVRSSVNPLTMTSQMRVVATKSFRICASNMLLGSNEKKNTLWFEAWKILFQLLFDEDITVREIASNITHEVAVRSNLVHEDNPCVDTFSFNQALLIFVYLTCPQYIDECRKILEEFVEESNRKTVPLNINGLRQSDSDSAKTTAPKLTLFDRSEINPYCDVHMMSQLCQGAMEAASRSNEDGFNVIDILKSKIYL